MDKVGASCDTASLGCYQHSSLGYGAARKVLMGQLHLKGSAGQYAVKDVYCERDFTSSDIGPGRVPNDTMINTEHTWPQSRFNRSMGKDVQKSDLHHLFPSDTEMNSVRGNHKFGDVAVPDKALKCSTVKIGTAAGGSEQIFEPPVAHKGNVARALFYFSIRYHLAIDPREEAFLKAWNRLDPVDQAERDRNDAIQKVQGNRNPFIDYPELVSEISDF
jgi:endonuclease I